MVVRPPAGIGFDRPRYGAAGAGMAFLLAGGVSSIPAAIAVWALARWPVFLAYLGFAFVGAFAAGIGFALFA